MANAKNHVFTLSTDDLHILDNINKTNRDLLLYLVLYDLLVNSFEHKMYSWFLIVFNFFCSVNAAIASPKSRVPKKQKEDRKKLENHHRISSRDSSTTNMNTITDKLPGRLIRQRILWVSQWLTDPTESVGSCSFSYKIRCNPVPIESNCRIERPGFLNYEAVNLCSSIRKVHTNVDE